MPTMCSKQFFTGNNCADRPKNISHVLRYVLDAVRKKLVLFLLFFSFSPVPQLKFRNMCLEKSHIGLGDTRIYIYFYCVKSYGTVLIKNDSITFM